MQRQLDRELEKLKLTVLEMAARTERAVDGALSSLLERDSVAAEAVMDKDADINRLQAEADERSLNMLALGQPKAGDLRFVIGSIHVAANLERIGDQAVMIAERALLFSARPPLPHYPLFDKLSEQAITMLQKSVKAYNTNDTDLATNVCAMKAKLDDLSLRVLKHYVDTAVNERAAVELAVHMIILARCLERVGALATNVAEHVLIIVKGINLRSTCQDL